MRYCLTASCPDEEVVLKQALLSITVTSCRNAEHVDLADVGWMREKWTDLMTRTHGDFAPPPFKCVELVG